MSNPDNRGQSGGPGEPQTPPQRPHEGDNEAQADLRTLGEQQRTHPLNNFGNRSEADQPRGFGSQGDAQLDHASDYGNWGGPGGSTQKADQNRDDEQRGGSSEDPGQARDWGNPTAHYGGPQDGGDELASGDKAPDSPDSGAIDSVGTSVTSIGGRMGGAGSSGTSGKSKDAGSE